MEQSSWIDASGTPTGSNADSKRHQLEGIQELPENVSDNGSIADPTVLEPSPLVPVTAAVMETVSSPILDQVIK